MKIAFINQPYDQVLPPGQNSIGLIVFNTAVELAKTEQVSLVGKSTGPQADSEWQSRYHAVRVPFDDMLHSSARRYPRWAAKLNFAWFSDIHPQYARRAAARVRSIGPDVVHLMNYWSWSRTLKSGMRRRGKLVLEMQCEWLSQKNRAAVAHQLEAVDAIAAVSDHIAALIRRSFPDFSRPIQTVYNGVNCDVFQPAPLEGDAADERRILFVGRVSPEKGVHTLIESFAHVVSRFRNARLDIVGAQGSLPSDLLVDLSDDPLVGGLRRFYDGTVTRDYRAHLDELVIRLGLERHIHFHGPLPHHELVKAYQATDVVVNPSLSESFGISIVEGMACGKPVVGTKVGGMLETILDGETGLLTDPEKPEMLAKAIISVLSDREQALAMSRLGRERAVGHFSWKARAARLSGLYQKLLLSS